MFSIFFGASTTGGGTETTPQILTDTQAADQAARQRSSRSAAALLATALAFVPLPPSAPTDTLVAPVYSDVIHRAKPHPARHSPSYQADRFQAPDPVTAPALPLTQPARVVRTARSLAPYAQAESIFGWVRLVPCESWEPCATAVPVVRRRLLTAAHLSTARAIDPPAAAPAGDTGGPSSRMGTVVTIQYQALTAPFTVTVQAETPQTDARTTDPVRRVARPVSSAVAPLFVPDVTNPVTVLSWKGTGPDRIHRLTFGTAQQRAFTSDTLTTPGEVIAPALTPPVYPAKVWAKQSPTGGSRHEAPAFVPDVTQPVTARSWAPSYPDKVYPAKGLRAEQQRAYQADRFQAPSEVIAPDLSWHPDYPERIRPMRSVQAASQPAYISDPTTPTLTPLPTPIRPDFARKRAPATPATTHTAPIYLADVTVTAPILSWKPQYVDLVWPKLGLRVSLHPFYQADKFDPPDVTVTAEVTVYARPVVNRVEARGVIRLVTATAVERSVS
jgi:hypothetical protein